MATTYRQNEVSLFGTYFPIIGPVRPTTINEVEERDLFGDSSKVSGPVLSHWVIDDQSGGIGVREADEEVHNKRSWWSELYTDSPGHIILPALVTDAGAPTSAAAPEVTIEFQDEQYVAFGTQVYKWLDTINDWSASLYTLPAIPTDVVVYKKKLYFACDADFARFDGTTWITGAALSSSTTTKQASRYLVVWDSKLLNLDNDGQLDYSVDEGVTWVANAPSDLASGSFNSLFLYRDAAGNVIVYLGTQIGAFSLNFDDAEWIETSVVFPRHEFAALGANRFNDFAYIPVGLTVREYSTDPPAHIRSMGLDRDDGIPGEYRGNIISIIPSHQEFFALLDATSIDDLQHFPASADHAYGNVQVEGDKGFSIIFRYNRHDSWSVVHKSSSTSKPVKCGAVSNANGKYRLWFGMDGKMFYRELQVTIQHPLEITDYEFGTGKEHITGKFNADNVVIRKTGTRFTICALGTSSTEYIELYYRINEDTAWILLANSTFTGGKVTSDGIHEFTFDTDKGIVFDTIQFRAVLTRSSTDTKVTPDLLWGRLSYLKESDVRFGFAMRIDCAHNYRRKTAKALRAALFAAAVPGQLGEFSFRKSNGADSHLVRILPPTSGVEIGETKHDGIYDILLVAP